MTLLYSLMFLPAMLLLRFLLTALLSYSNVTAVNWHEFKRKQLQWHRDVRPATEDVLLRLGTVSAGDREDFNATLDNILIPRVVGSVGHAKVREYIAQSMSELDWDVQRDTFQARTPYGRKEFTNIVATLDPSACHRLVLACHYDSKMHQGGTFLGATDSAVPCAQLIHLARVLDDRLKKQRRKHTGLTLQFMFFDGEEAFVQWSSTDSLYGSRHLAERLHRHRVAREQREALNCSDRDVINELDRMEVLVLLDLIGTANPKFHSYFGDTQSLYSRLVQIEQRLNDAGLMEAPAPQSRTRYFEDRSVLGFVEDDHIPFMKRGVPIVHLIPSPFPHVWHTLADNRENLHHPTISNLNKVLKVFVAEYLHLE